jgi:subtilisin family serine protease
VVFIASVGNEGGSAQPLYPAADANVIAVTATDRSDAVFKDANPCSVACVAAPGVDVLVAEPGDAYGFLSGTSMAAAHVSGVVALMLDANPTLEPKAIRDLLFKTAKHLNPGEREQKSIAGVVDAYGALKGEISPEAENAIGAAATPVASSGKAAEGRSVGH